MKWSLWPVAHNSELASVTYLRSYEPQNVTSLTFPSNYQMNKQMILLSHSDGLLANQSNQSMGQKVTSSGSTIQKAKLD